MVAQSRLDRKTAGLSSPGAGPSQLGAFHCSDGASGLLRASIVTISFNQAEFLERTIESVLGQDYPDIEYIVVDPGSTDGSREIIQRFGPRIAHVLLEPDGGPAEGLNRGFSVATGDVFSFLNSDDILYPHSVTAAVSYFMKNPSIDVVSGHARIIGPDDQVLRRTYSDRMSVLRYVYSSVALIQPSTFFRSSAYKRTSGFNTNNRATWDGELFFSMAEAGCRFGRSSDIWSGYRLHEQSITASKKTENAVGQVRDEIFQRTMGRQRNRYDKGIEAALRVWKHVANPRNTMERIVRGPVFGRNPN